MGDYEDSMGGNVYTEDTFLEADEDETYEQQYRRQSNYGANDVMTARQDNDAIDDRPLMNQSYVNGDQQPDDGLWYGGVRKETARMRRRRSRELTDSDVQVTSNEDEPRRKPETMRSISEDTPTRTIKQPVTRRTLSHPENESQVNVQRMFLSSAEH